MLICRALFVAVIVGLSLHQAGAQFGGVPGMPGAGGPGFGAAPQAPPPQCMQLMELRNDIEKHGKAIEAANKRKATVQQACQLFKNYLSAEAKFLRGLEQNMTVCGVPPEVPQQIRLNHAKAKEVGKQVCEAAAQGARSVGPSLSDALGANPPLPSTDGQKGAGVFETLTGNPFAR